ncbi:MAG: HAD-IIB family hydrolase [Desulfurococcales archaeon]|nr:HAD-IIB family hydrolase [Desulfurococcales archaeon]MCE4605044.1 HAD-IIB family hydrolase [Desulfurococcales archaeon]
MKPSLLRAAIFTDIDWTMMGPGEDLKGVCSIVEKAYSLGVPVIPVTAKSIYEIVALAPRACIPINSLVAVSESGGAIYASPGLLSAPEGSKRVLGYILEYIELGSPIQLFQDKLAWEASRLGCEVYLLSQANTSMASMMTGLSPSSARLASMREYLEVIWSPSQKCLDILAIRLGSMGFYVHRSTRLLHVAMHKGKLAAIARLEEEPLFTGLHTIGLGDSDADRDYLEHVDTAILVPSPSMRLRTRLMRSDYMVAPYPAPEGWSYTVNQLLLVLT